MSQFIRKTQPDCVRYFFQIFQTIRGNVGVTIEQLVQFLIKEASLTKSAATETVENAVHDGLLVPVPSPPSEGHSPRHHARLHERRFVRLPELNEIEITRSTHDCYCFECHLPGMLEQCRQCTRSFHRLCYRRDPERPNYSVPSPKLQKNRLPAFSSDTDSDDAENDGASTAPEDSTIVDYESDIRASSSLQLPLDHNSLTSWTTPQRIFIDEITVDSTSSPVPTLTPQNSLGGGCSVGEGKPCLTDLSTDQLESKTKVEVVCIGEVRPPTRKRPATTGSSISYKSEISPADEDEADLELCTCCRLLKIGALRSPPNMQSDELCHLIGFTFSRNRTWVTVDVSSYLEALKLTAKEIELITKMLFKIPDRHLDDIAMKLSQNPYSYLMDFLVDILDLQHNIGIFFGSNSTEMESTKWLVRDIAHDLSEIRRCPDCFRYSHEKNSNIWFAKPCVQRHELVFAKHSGFSYWPAKVIRVLPNNKYDVRFFGGKHSRALIDVRFIRPIDTDLKSLKLGSSLAIKKAMEELRYHQVLSTYPPSKFSFHADKQETAQIIRTVLDRGPTGMGGRRRSNKRGRKSKSSDLRSVAISDVERLSQANEQNSITECAYTNEMGKSIPTKRARSNKTSSTNGNDEEPKRVTRSLTQTPTAADLKKIQDGFEEARRIAKIVQQRNDKLQEQISKLKESIRKHECEQKILKRKEWCYWCLNEAIYLCCFRAAYCSEECQSRHWNDGHKKVCKNQDALKHATSNRKT